MFPSDKNFKDENKNDDKEARLILEHYRNKRMFPVKSRPILKNIIMFFKYYTILTNFHYYEVLFEPN